MSDLQLEPGHLAAVAPYLIAFRRDLSIHALGPGWASADPAAAAGGRLDALVRIERPPCPMDFDEMVQRTSSGFSMTARSSGLPLRGPLVRVGEDLLVFFGAIWITDARELDRFGLTLGDLPQGDRDFLFALRTKDAAIADAERIAARLTDQQLRERRAAQAVAAQLAVTRVLAGAPSLESAVPDVVKALCDVVGWSFGAVWYVDRRTSDRLRCLGTWTREGRAPGFADASRERTFARGEGLPGRVWASGAPIWIEDVTRDENFPRAEAAVAAGLRSAFALPVVVSGDRGPVVMGVVEAFGEETRPPDPQVLSVVTSLGSQVGQFLERRRSEAALRESEERLRLIIESAIDAVVLIDAHGIVRAWNPQAERTFGWSAAEAIGRSLGDLIVPEPLRQAHDDGLRRYRDTGVGHVLGQRLEMPARHRSGREFTVELSIAPVLRPEVREDEADRGAGWPVLFSGFLRDITERREAEAALRRAKDDAEAAAAAKAEFLATMSHEIRTPMNAIIGLTGLLMDAPLEPQQADYLRTVRDAGESLLATINDILDFSKIDAGHLSLESIVFAPADLAADVVDLFRPSAQARGLEMRLSIRPGVPVALRADPGRLRQILTNLVANAVKFTPAGTVVVTVDVSQDDVLELAVADTGVGIAADVMPRLFKPFSQADSSMTRRYGGTGLGLAICDRLVRLMRGTIDVESQPGAGSLFRVRVPVSRATPDMLPAVSEASRAVTSLGPAASTIRVLVVEDNPANQLVAVAMLRRLGVRADQVGDGSEALEAVRRVPYDVILMDCQLPGIDGYESARRLRAIEAAAGGPRVPIIAMTANALVGERERCLEAGMDDYLAKPVRLAQLADALERWAPTRVRGGEPVGTGRREGAHLEGLRAILGDEWEETVRVFDQHSRQTIGELAEVLASRDDAGTVVALAHRLAGGAGMMGATALEALARGLEESAASGLDRLDATARLAAIQAEFDRVIVEYR